MSHTNQSHPHPLCGLEVLPKRGLVGLVSGGGGGVAGIGLQPSSFAADSGAAALAAFVLAFRVIWFPSFFLGAAFGFGFGSFACLAVSMKGSEVTNPPKCRFHGLFLVA